MENFDRHLSPEEIIDYIEGKLPAGNIRRVEIHFARCSECVSIAREMQLLQQAWQTWSAEEHGKIYLQARMNAALIAAAEKEENPEWKERLLQWRASWSGKARVLVNIVKRAPGSTSKLISEGLESLMAGGEEWEFELLPISLASRGEEDAGPETQVVKIKAAEVDLSPQSRKAQIQLEWEGDVIVRVKNFSPTEKPPLIVLFSKENEMRSWVKELTKEKDSADFSAHFARVPPGNYLALFEP